MATISIWLFGKPEWEFNGKVSAKEIKSKGEELKNRLKEVSETMEKLLSAGWDYEMTLYDLQFYKNISKKNAEKELKRLDLNKDAYQVDEFEEE